ncbi:methyltransferase domain-containing protein [Lactifluus volemus]|nr:methyltransferase domain-containing protein [Lactifluus volemus]
MPRPTFIALAALLTVGFILLLPSFISTLPVHTSYYCHFFNCGPSLSAWLESEDARYSIALQRRQELIKTWGPSEDSVESYPQDTSKLYTLWDFYIPAFQCPHHVERVGTRGDGGKWVCGVERVAKQEKCVIYSFGINGESSFEADLLTRAPGCEVWGYDFSVTRWGPEISNNVELNTRAHFQPWGISGTDNHTERDHPKFWTIDSLMKHNGHTFIDVLKCDIEGSEFDTLTAFVAANADKDALPIGQIQLEIHTYGDRGQFAYFNHWWTALEAAGLRPFWTEPNLVALNLYRGIRPDVVEYSFMNIRGNHALVNEAFN